MVQLAGLLEDYGFEEIHINHNAEVNIIASISSKTIAFEYENYNNKNLDIIIKKKVSALEKYDKVWFVCSSSDEKYISKAVGEHYTLARGARVREILETYAKVDGWVQEKAQNQLSEVVISGCEPITAL